MWRDEANWVDSGVWDEGNEPVSVMNLDDYPITKATQKPGGVRADLQRLWDRVVNIVSYDNTTDFTISIPAGYRVEGVIIENKTASACQLSFGTTSGGIEIYGGFSIGSSELIEMTINKTFSMSSSTTIYVNSDNLGDTWNSCTINFYVTLKKLI